MIAKNGNADPTRERRRHGVARATQQIADAHGAIGCPYLARDLLASMERRGAITPAMRSAGEEFRALFRRAQLDPLRCADLARVPGCGRPAEPSSVERARHDVWQRLQQVGGIASPAGSCLWHVVGSEQSLRQWALTQGWAGRLVSQEAASGILIAALGTLAHWRASRGAPHSGAQTMALISGSDKGGKAPKETSRPSHVALGSGSRPGPSKVQIETSSPDDPHTQGRGVPGSLK